MKINAFTVSAILAHCAIAAPLCQPSDQPTDHQMREIRDLPPIAISVADGGLLVPAPESAEDSTVVGHRGGSNEDDLDSLASVNVLSRHTFSNEALSRSSDADLPAPPQEITRTGSPFNHHLDNLEDFPTVIDNLPDDRQMNQGNDAGPVNRTQVKVDKAQLNSTNVEDVRAKGITVDFAELLLYHRIKNLSYEVQVEGIHKISSLLGHLNISKAAMLNHGEILRDLCLGIDSIYNVSDACAARYSSVGKLNITSIFMPLNNTAVKRNVPEEIKKAEIEMAKNGSRPWTESTMKLKNETLTKVWITWAKKVMDDSNIHSMRDLDWRPWLQLEKSKKLDEIHDEILAPFLKTKEHEKHPEWQREPLVQIELEKKELEKKLRETHKEIWRPWIMTKLNEINDMSTNKTTSISTSPNTQIKVRSNNVPTTVIDINGEEVYRDLTDIDGNAMPRIGKRMTPEQAFSQKTNGAAFNRGIEEMSRKLATGDGPKFPTSLTPEQQSQRLNRLMNALMSPEAIKFMEDPNIQRIEPEPVATEIPLGTEYPLPDPTLPKTAPATSPQPTHSISKVGVAPLATATNKAGSS